MKRKQDSLIGYYLLTRTRSSWVATPAAATASSATSTTTALTGEKKISYKLRLRKRAHDWSATWAGPVGDLPAGLVGCKTSCPCQMLRLPRQKFVKRLHKRRCDEKRKQKSSGRRRRGVLKSNGYTETQRW